MSKFKVGDRVHVARRCGPEFVGVAFLIDKFDDDGRKVWGHINGEYLWAWTSCIELMPLNIEVGKFYRTRDGRKVGPMRWSKDGVLWATADGFPDPCWYTQYNMHFNGNYANVPAFGETSADDLVAEWVDEPVKANPAVQVDNLRDEYGGSTAPKFKVGDRVRETVPPFDAAIVREINSAGRVKVEWGDENGNWSDNIFWDAAEFELIADDQAGSNESFGPDDVFWADLGLDTDQREHCEVCGEPTYTPADIKVIDVRFDVGNGMMLYDLGTFLDWIDGQGNADVPCIVVSGKNGPSRQPVVHPNHDAAAAEAERLAALHPGVEFSIYERVGGRVAEVTVREAA